LDHELAHHPAILVLEDVAVAAVRWLGRLCLERPDVTLTELRLALVAFERLPVEPDDAAAELRWLVWR
jgi:hypothetical protein